MTLDLAMVRYDPQSTSNQREKIDELDFIKVKSFCASMDTYKSVRDNP